MIVAAPPEQAGLVEMDMSVDEAGNGEASAQIDVRSLGGDPRRNGRDPAGADADVHGAVMAEKCGTAEDQVELGHGRRPAGQTAFS